MVTYQGDLEEVLCYAKKSSQHQFDTAFEVCKLGKLLHGAFWGILRHTQMKCPIRYESI